MLNSEAMNAKLNPFSDAQSVSLPYTAQVPKSLLSKDVKVERNIFTSINDNHTTILYDPLIKKGIVRFEVYSIRSLDKIGIADDSVRYERKEDPEARGFDKIVRYDCPGWIQHSGDFIEGNAKFRTEDSVALELNMDSRPRTLTFFVNDEEQPNYVTNIPAAVRAFMMFKDESFKVLKFESLPAPTAQHAAGSRFWEFGKYWKKDK
ncbi:MAG: hypothetical protein EZS28_009943 [Streblomastix strix]|uniref:Uncharacterized protein n=1 Tax=Streblomastix strix TaxID=222440 RepID=A0A5J4WHZ3_9EUKA|nr:MAG: hypothetical protein EZS28_009943 [Streblomastix strix]